MTSPIGISGLRSMVKELWLVMRHEFYIITHDHVIIALLFIVPVILFPLFCLIYNTGVITDLPMAVYDADNSQLSRGMTRSLDASSTIKITQTARSINELATLLRSGSVCSAVYFPPEMESDLKRGKQVCPVIYKNAQNIQTGNLIYKEALSILRTYNAGIVLKKMRAQGFPEKQALALVNPVATDVSILYNPNFSYSTFLCPGVIFAQFQVIIMLIALLMINLEFRNRHCHDYPAPYATTLKPGAILLSAIVPYLIIIIGVAAAVLGILFPLFNIHLHRSFGALFFMTVLFGAASFMPGLLAGLLFRKAVSGVAFSIVYNMPAFIFSGFTFPLWAMPQPLAALANILPFTHYATAFFKIGLIGEPLSSSVPELVILMLFIVLPLIPALWLFAAKRRRFFDITSKPLHTKAQA